MDFLASEPKPNKPTQWELNVEETEELKARIRELEKAIADAQSWVKAGEGVNLWYYHENYGDNDSVNVIQEVVLKSLLEDGHASCVVAAPFGENANFGKTDAPAA